jgi:hypothetical protein
MVILCEGLHAIDQLARRERLRYLSNDQSDDRWAVSSREGWCPRESAAIRIAM